MEAAAMCFGLHFDSFHFVLFQFNSVLSLCTLL